MNLIKSKKWRTCKKCNGDIFPNSFYYPQRRGKSICFNCGNSKVNNTFIDWLLEKLK